MSGMLCNSNEKYRLVAYGLGEKDSPTSPLQLVTICNTCEKAIVTRTITRAEVMAFPMEVMMDRVLRMSESDRAKASAHTCQAT